MCLFILHGSTVQLINSVDAVPYVLVLLEIMNEILPV